MGPVECVCRDEVVQALNEVKTGKAPELLNVSLDSIASSSNVQCQ